MQFLTDAENIKSNIAPFSLLILKPLFSGNGRCIAFDSCQCTEGWTGPSCSLPDCSEVNQCSQNGECVEPNTCNCYEGYQGASCNTTLNCTHLDDCNDNGLCVLDHQLDSPSSEV